MKNWKKTLLNENSSIGSAIKSLNESRLQIVLVVKKNLKLIGTITDGDIRRKLLSGHSIKSSIKKRGKSKKFINLSINNNSRRFSNVFKCLKKTIINRYFTK